MLSRHRDHVRQAVTHRNQAGDHERPAHDGNDLIDRHRESEYFARHDHARRNEVEDPVPTPKKTGTKFAPGQNA